MKQIAIIEDDAGDLADLVRILSTQGECIAFSDGGSFMEGIGQRTFDLACIDWNLPDTTGRELVRQIRSGVLAPRLPIILITARIADGDVVAGLVSGADDYVSKPVRSLVLLARMEALMRRVAPAAADRIETFGEYSFDRSRSAVVTADRERILTTKEFALALLLFRNMHRPLARSFLLEEVWGAAAHVSSRTLDTHVCRLKAKLGLTPANGYNFGPVYGFGYRLEKTADADAQLDRSERMPQV